MTLAITTYNRTDLLFESYSKVLDDDRISEIIIVDDCSPIEVFEQIQKEATHPKITLVRNAVNLGMLSNKRKAISLSSNEWVIILDSDNVIDQRYLATIPKKLNPDTIYCPSFAEPNFNYTEYEGWTITKENAHEFMDDKMFRCCLNTCNYLVHKDTFLNNWQTNPEMKGSDTIWMNYKWLESGKSIYVVPNMRYYHRVHDGSGWLENAKYNIQQTQKIEKLIYELRNV
jgi:glycosyltransferase involved in cell wall biosynthesis